MTVQQVWRSLEIHLMEAKEIYGEYLINAQGEDVVAGTRTPQYITKKASKRVFEQKKNQWKSQCLKHFIQLKKKF